MRLALERMYYKVCIHSVNVQQCQLRNGRQPSQWEVKESNYKVAKRKQKTDAD
jgi:hypothetical protein